MTSPEQKDQIQCKNCELLKNEIQKKEAKIKILESNLLKIKSLLSESGSLIDSYNEINEENKNLKIEIERLKDNINKNSSDNYQFNLLKEKMLRLNEDNEKMRSLVKFYDSQKNQDKNSKNSNETKLKRELSQKDKEINELNMVISILKLKNKEDNISNDKIIQNYKKSIGDNIIALDELNFLTINNNNDNHINGDFNLENEYRSNINTNSNYNNAKMLDLIKENECLNVKIQECKTKYHKYKTRYREFSKSIKFFMGCMKILPPGNNIIEFIESLMEKNNKNLIGNKRNRDKEDINLLNNFNILRNIQTNNSNGQRRKNNDDNFKGILQLPSVLKESSNNFDKNDENYELDEEEKSNIKKSGRGRTKRIKKEKQEIEKSQSKEKNKNDDDKNKLKTESKKRGRKPKKDKDSTNKKTTEKIEIKKENDKDDEIKDKIKKENNIKKESKIKEEIEKEKEIKNVENKDIKVDEMEEEQKDNFIDEVYIIKDKDEENKNKLKEMESKEQKDKKNGKKIIDDYVGPVPKNIKKKLDPAAQQAINTNNLLNLLSNNPEKISDENLNPILSLQETLHEKISYIFEIIMSNLIQLELSRVLTLFETFIDITKEDSKPLVGINILENINLHLNANSLLNKKIHLKIANKSNETYKTYITKNFSSPIFLISFLIDILYRKLTDISCVSNYIYKLVFDKNIDEKNKSKILIVLTHTLKENLSVIDNDKLYYKEEQYNKYVSPENENKVYFLLYYKNTLISKNIFNFILSIYPHETNSEINIDNEIQSRFANLFNSIPDDQELKIEIPNFPEEYKSSIKFNKDLFYLEIFQALCIIVEIKDIKWIAKNIFSDIIWKNFNSSKKDSLKRALSIYYSSLLFYLCLKVGIKNHESENILDQLEFNRIYAWLYGIFNPQPQYENLIGFYEKICALVWIVESPIMTMSDKVFVSIKPVICNIIKGEKESLCPIDFLEKIKRLKLI